MIISEECINGCLQRDSSSQKHLYEQSLPYLNALCSRYVNNPSLRKDVLQESYILIFNKIGQFDPQRGTFKSWVSRIVINNCLKQNKSEKRFTTLEVNQQEEYINPVVISQLTNKEIILFLRTMPEKYSKVFLLFAIDEFSHKEISEMLGININVSRKRLSRARDWLKTKSNSWTTVLGNLT
ncbi:MAG: RNA polymerase sigma factor [Bacteroidia bacterium]